MDNERNNLKFMNMSEILDYTFHVFRKSMFHQMAISGIAICAFILTTAFLFLGILIMVLLVASLGGFGWFLSVFIALFFVALYGLIYSWQACGYMEITKQVYYGEPIMLGLTFKKAFQSFFRVFTTFIAKYIVFIPVFFIWLFFMTVGLIAIGVSLSDNVANLDAFYNYPNMPVVDSLLSMATTLYNIFVDVILPMLALLLIGLVIFFIIATFISCIFSLSASVSYFEKRYFFPASWRGFKLIKGNFFKTLVIVTIGSILGTVIIYDLLLIYDVIIKILTAGNPLSLFRVGYGFLYSLVSFALTLLLAPIYSILTTVLYFNRKTKHEGLDIEIRANDLLKELEQQTPKGLV